MGLGSSPGPRPHWELMGPRPGPGRALVPVLAQLPLRPWAWAGFQTHFRCILKMFHGIDHEFDQQFDHELDHDFDREFVHEFDYGFDHEWPEQTNNQQARVNEC